MIEKKEGTWRLCKYKVYHKSHGNEQVHYTNDRDYWRETVDKHDHLTDLRFEEMSYSAEQKRRLEKLNKENPPEPFKKTAKEMVSQGVKADSVVREKQIKNKVREVEDGIKTLDEVDQEYRDAVDART